MCGIAGILHRDGRPCTAEDVSTFTDSLAHRGPDGRGVWTDGPIGLGHRRLAIIDLTEHGHQPMRSADGDLWVTFNGEIYNFVEVRAQLESAGHRFRTDSDTEVILASYREWGTDCVHHFNGMWAFAIWNVPRRELFLSRDRFGVKPLRYVDDPRRFAFASELKAFRHLRDFDVRENVEEMQRLLSTGAPSMEDTPFHGVKRLPGGYNMLVNDRGIRTWRWWRTIDHLPSVPSRFADQVDQFRELFLDAVRVRLRSDVPVGASLSGGLDSSSIVCAVPEVRRASAARPATDRQHAFVATFPDTVWDEREFAEAAIERAGAHPHLMPVELDEVLDNLEQYAYDIELVGDRLSIPHWLTYRQMRRSGISVTLDGNGADEMLAGYFRAYRHSLRTSANMVTTPRRTLALMQIMRGLYGPGSVPGGPAPSLLRLLAEFDPATRGLTDGARRVARRLRGSAPVPVEAPKRPQWNPYPAPPTISYAMDEDTRDLVKQLGVLKGHLYQDFHGTTLPNVLRTFDRCSMAHGVEIRMPFMDWRLVSYVFALPDESIAGKGYTKRILREAMRGILPEKIRTRTGKTGFSSPMPVWLGGALGELVDRQVQSSAFLECELWNGPAIRDFVAAKRGHAWSLDEGNLVWRYVQAHLWRQAVHGGRAAASVRSLPSATPSSRRATPSRGT